MSKKKFKLLHIPTLEYVVDSKKWLNYLDGTIEFDLSKIIIKDYIDDQEKSGVILFTTKKSIRQYLSYFKQYYKYSQGGLVLVGSKDDGYDDVSRYKDFNEHEFMIESVEWCLEYYIFQPLNMW